MTEAKTYTIVQAEIATGIILTLDGKRCLDGRIPNIPAQPLEDARRIAKAIVDEKPHIECWIKDESGNLVELIRGKIASSSPKKLSWWQRLFGKGGS